VWFYLIRSELRAQWLALGELELNLDVSFELVSRNGNLSNPADARPERMSEEHRATYEILEVDPPRGPRYLWTNAGEVTFDLNLEGKDVLLTLRHRRLSSRRLVLGVTAR
jgi:uncharacterized protein YndB with AHSA1/START domain